MIVYGIVARVIPASSGLINFGTPPTTHLEMGHIWRRAIGRGHRSGATWRPAIDSYATHDDDDDDDGDAGPDLSGGTGGPGPRPPTKPFIILLLTSLAFLIFRLLQSLT